VSGFVGAGEMRLLTPSGAPDFDHATDNVERKRNRFSIEPSCSALRKLMLSRTNFSSK